MKLIQVPKLEFLTVKIGEKNSVDYESFTLQFCHLIFLSR